MKKVTLAQALQTYLEAEEARAPTEHPLQDDPCPTIGEWEAHLARSTPLRAEQHEHALSCHYCQITTRALREELGSGIEARMPVWWAAAPASDGPRNRLLPAVVKGESGGSAFIELTHGPFLDAQGRLSLTINVIEPKLTPRELPVRLELVARPERTLLHTFELPGLRAQRLVIKLPQELLRKELWQEIGTQWPNLEPNKLPLLGIIEPGREGLAETEPAPD